MKAARWIAVGWLGLGGATAFAQEESLARARELYASAAYEDALTALEGIDGGGAAADRRQAGSLKAFCLLALGRRVEGEAAFRSHIEADPTFKLDEAEVSPAVRTVFTDVRAALLPALIERTYAAAKAAFEQGDREGARAGFEHVLAFGAEASARGLGAGADLRLVAAGFLDLLKAHEAGRSEPAVSTAGPAAPVQSVSDSDVLLPPVAIAQDVPIWTPPSAQVGQITYKGIVEVNVDEEGNVTSATLIESVHPAYDRALVAAARSWKYQPAQRGGRPTPFVKRVEVVLKGR
jgi:TonB family protein